MLHDSSDRHSDDRLGAALAKCPVVAILRGLEPERAIEVGEALFDAGIRIMEVPANSPDPFGSIAQMAKHFADRAVVGAGTILTMDHVAKVKAAGGQVVVSPNMNADVIRATKAMGMYALPGCFTATEAFAALDAGADGLKLFPGEAFTPAMIKALRAVLPPQSRVLVVGGIGADNMSAFTEAGANGFGIGSWLFKPGRPTEEIAERARQVVAACQNT
ncbi:2-keto-3-deoxy-phosphogalactonate aldolase [Cohaesibacter sp. ES.047]|uniref:2-dehydro-3-deoxy-6-phosphogalactonate aldolase n=1 Tax=Cohaesibacter sp. ES.047 TaxID=1798205 RepID=UPI000BB9A50C|nr:2-dehydro-3-deoxy-6-phosphogalactonate aldolase [Cohaesibacter sp. ES.047]SNY89981.1 2-keto-3-deoxy-phosphogalactonate aldolase [Cohaesibacter sp. ES.047]